MAHLNTDNTQGGQGNKSKEGQSSSDGKNQTEGKDNVDEGERTRTGGGGGGQTDGGEHQPNVQQDKLY